ncbi:uncharacterized protein I206_100251 [Kwoniella pini CBS 10737]|uniref:Uncharacterized protein n=1 Tax=Kwoniella pini CBS 10737 TaxID=1296096 RepID=A0A1B9IE38_9TREE|nr:uncharacterized protein I206_01074 [Kwoniella pini CBS 10737]OCF53767.1 hypothetical protein I206_01074 [Kwoniella pini CBS 10737]
MRISIITAILISAYSTTTTFASPLLKTDSIDKNVKSVETPKNFHQNCDNHNVQCKATNEAVYGSVNHDEGSIGKQIGNISNTGSQITSKEGEKDLSKTFSNNGKTLQNDLQGRKVNNNNDNNNKNNHGHSELNENLKSIGDNIYPQELLSESGKFIQTQGESAQLGGNGINTMGKQANKDSQYLSKGQKSNGGKIVNSVMG